MDQSHKNDKSQTSEFSELPSSVQLAIDQLPRGLYAHIGRVRRIANELALTFGLDTDRIDFAAATHDIARAANGEFLLQTSMEYGIRIHPIEKSFPVLLHGPVGARKLSLEFGINDTEILEAVYWHTTGHPSMGELARVVFLADKLDPIKKSRYEFIDEISLIARNNTVAAVKAFLSMDIDRLTRQGSCAHPLALLTKENIGKKKGTPL